MAVIMTQMQTYIALFRGINVGGHHLLPMKELKLVLEKSGCDDVQTYIQSGNVVFRSTSANVARLTERLATAISNSHGFEPRVFVLTRARLEQAAAANPFPEAEREPKSVHLFFLNEDPKRPDLKSLEALKTKSERFELKRGIFYLHTPEGFGRSKLAGSAEKLLGVEATARNWRTVRTLVEMARSQHGSGS